MFSTSAMPPRSRSSISSRGCAHGGFPLLDTQFVTEHLRQFGTIEINREEFHRLLEKSLDVDADFKRLAPDASPDMILRSWRRRLPHSASRGYHH